jgi:hypothetical protein
MSDSESDHDYLDDEEIEPLQEGGWDGAPPQNVPTKNKEPSQEQITQAIADMISSDKYTEEYINDVISGKKLPPGLEYDMNKTVNQMTTNGLEMQSDEIKLMSYENKKKLTQCSGCARCYNSDMITRNDQLCWHCFFWMNYDINARPFCDGNEGLTIVQYILKCHEEHNEHICTKHTEHGGCFLCEYKLSIPILCVKDEHLLVPEKEEPTEIITNELDVPRETFNTVSISI